MVRAISVVVVRSWLPPSRGGVSWLLAGVGGGGGYGWGKGKRGRERV